jgi:hypothetical protein
LDVCISDGGLDLELAGKKKRKKKVIFDMNKLDAALPEIKTNEEGGLEGTTAPEEGQPEVVFITPVFTILVCRL